MGLFDRGRKQVLEGGIEGSALIRESNPYGEPGARSNSGETIFDLELNRFGNRNYRFALEVRIPDRDPYEVEGDFKVPRKAENTGFLAADVGNALKPGLELPVRVDPNDRESIEVDWDRYLSSPGRKQAQRAATQSDTNRKVREEMEKKPKLLEKMRAQNRNTLQVWAGAVKAGNMSREQFEESVRLEVETGRMDLADAEAARETLDG